MFRPLMEADFPAAAALLAEGFPNRSLAFWESGLNRLRVHARNQEAGVPLGLLLQHEGQLAGVALMPASLRQRADGSRYPLVNVSSWYVRPEHRLRAAPMLRAMVADKRCAYIDLTPTEEVRRMLPLFGFKTVNAGTTVGVLPLLALGSAAAARIRPLRADDVLPAQAPPLEMLLAHRELDCESVLLEHEGGQTLFVYRSRPVRRLPAARLKYIGSHAVMQRCLPVLARHLLARGFLLMSWDTRGTDAPSTASLRRRPGGLWFARGETFDDVTDFIGTELCILGV
ncbi:MAG: hypothetical protein JNJ71_07615 [Rubrivivax sp.]|nr:hypothetical protein [Rubrivivax sp.]